MPSAAEKLAELKMGMSLMEILQCWSVYQRDVTDLARLAGVSPATICNWVRRYGGTVTPIKKRVIIMPLPPKGEETCL